MATKKKAPAKKAPAAKRRSSAITGPLTLEEARMLAGVETETARQAATARRAAAPRRAPGIGAVSASTSPADVAVERRKLKLREREELKQRKRDYKATMDLLQSHGVKGLPASPPAKPSRRRASGPVGTQPRTGPLRVFAEGDSWFDYPALFFGGGLVPRLESRLGVPILNLAKAGDETRFMLGVEQRQLIAQHLREGCPDGTPWELMLFSGGGNDIVAQPLALWLNDYAPGLPVGKLLNKSRYSNALALVQAAYEDLIKIRDQTSPQTQLAFHAYDFAIPDGRGICGLGPWLKPAFDVHGFPGDLVNSTAVVREMLLQFKTMLQALAQSEPRITFINAQGTLAPIKASWHNEMHPSKGGFNQIADVFSATINELFPGRVVA